jgi:hypothetical protein
MWLLLQLEPHQHTLPSFLPQDKFQKAFREEFEYMSTPGVVDQLNAHFGPTTREYIMNQWALIEAQQMAEALAWTVADITLNVGALVDPTGIVDLVAAYAKPTCLEVSAHCPSRDYARVVQRTLEGYLSADGLGLPVDSVSSARPPARGAPWPSHSP